MQFFLKFNKIVPNECTRYLLALVVNLFVYHFLNFIDEFFINCRAKSRLKTRDNTLPGK